MVKLRKKRVLIAALVVLVLFLNGCGLRKTEDPSDANYRTGTEGLVLSFPTNSITEAYEEDDVNFNVEIKNRGAFPQSDETIQAYLWIGGYDENMLDIESTSGGDMTDGSVSLPADDLEGKSAYNENGGYSSVEFGMSVLDLPPGTTSYKPKLIVTASYGYKTIASTVVCIDPEPRSQNVREKVCTMQDSTGLGSQGAPVAVSRIEQDVTSDAFLFKIYIDNVGGGLVIPEAYVYNNPNEGYGWGTLNKVRLGQVTLGPQESLTCKPVVGSDVQMVDGKGYIFCRADRRDKTRVYETALSIELNYGYTNSIEKQIEVFEKVTFG